MGVHGKPAARGAGNKTNITKKIQKRYSHDYISRGKYKQCLRAIWE